MICPKCSTNNHHGKYCKRCEYPLRDEFKRHVEIKIKVNKIPLIVMIISAIAILAICGMIYHNISHYSYDVYVTEEIIDKNTETELIYMPCGDSFIVYEEITYTLIFENSDSIEVEKNTYNKYSVGDEYCYKKATYTKWKPEYADAPTPIWVYMTPCVALLVMCFAYSMYVFIKLKRREIEMDEFDNDGDLIIDRED